MITKVGHRAVVVVVALVLMVSMLVAVFVGASWF
jgi:hypothetical protein